MKEEKILIDNIRVNYKIAGSGPAVLVLHGWGGSSDSWIRVAGLLAEKGYKTVVPDFPGFGKTPPPSRPWSVRDYSDFVLKFAETLGLSDFFLLGHSFGGRISIKLATLYPEKVRKLILCASAGVKPKPSPFVRLIYWLARLGNAFFTPRHLIRFKDAARNVFYIFLRNKDYVKSDGVMRETIQKVLVEDLLPELSKIEKETLIVWGQADRMVPVRYASVFHENIKDSKLEIFPKIGHSPHLEVPGKFSQIIVNFLS